jgi:ketosteroid isomerase-like protein
MSTQVSSTTFDVGRFCAAAEGRDVETQLSMYAPDAVVAIADRINAIRTAPTRCARPCCA